MGEQRACWQVFVKVTDCVVTVGFGTTASGQQRHAAGSRRERCRRWGGDGCVLEAGFPSKDDPLQQEGGSLPHAAHFFYFTAMSAAAILADVVCETRGCWVEPRFLPLACASPPWACVCVGVLLFWRFVALCFEYACQASAGRGGWLPHRDGEPRCGAGAVVHSLLLFQAT